MWTTTGSRWHDGLTKLRAANVGSPKITNFAPPDTESPRKLGAIIVGSPQFIRQELESQIEELNLNHMIFGFFIGTISHEHAMQSISFFAKKIMPELN